MVTQTTTPANIDEYITACSPEIRVILRRIRATISAAAPDAQEIINYRMPAFTQHGVLVYFAAFKSHIGLYPPVSGDAKLEKALSAYAGPKGNLKFPLDQPIPYGLIAKITTLRVKQNLAKSAAKASKRRTARSAAAHTPLRRPPAARDGRGRAGRPASRGTRS